MFDPNHCWDDPCMRRINRFLIKEANQGKYDTYISMQIHEQANLRDGGCDTSLLVKESRNSFLYHVSWMDPSGPFAIRLKELADIANVGKQTSNIGTE